MSNRHETELAPFVAEVVISPEQKELVFHEDIVAHKGPPVQQLVGSERETSTEQIRGAFFKGDSKQGLSW